MARDLKSSIVAEPKTLAVMPTRACPSACRHCGSFSSPHARDKLDLKVMSKAIRQAKDLGFGLIAFTGGEATLEWENLLQCLNLAKSLGLRTRLVTNAHWAHSLDSARRVINELKSNGLDEINYSTGDEHARFIPVENVVNAIVTALELDYSVQVMVEYRSTREITKNSLLEYRLIKNLPSELYGKIDITESPWMPINPNQSGNYLIDDVVNSNNVHLREGCKSLLQTYTIQPDGRVGACCGLGMEIIPELQSGFAEGDGFLHDAIIDAEGDFLKLWIRYKGPEKILAWASSKNPEIKWENIYAHRCQACQQVYKDPKVAKVIRENYEEILVDVLQSLVFDEEFYPKRMISIRDRRVQLVS